MENHNKLLGKVAGVDGLKTGFTNSAGYCLSATAQRDGRRVIVVIMGSLGRRGEHDFGRFRDVKAIELLERGFAALPVTAPSPVSAESTRKRAPRIIIPTAPPAPAPEEPMLKLSLPKK
jgi:D-alanyl-D-alanine carboxypeptidase (penicillin-binding protein 5/6)